MEDAAVAGRDEGNPLKLLLETCEYLKSWDIVGGERVGENDPAPASCQGLSSVDLDAFRCRR